MMDLLLIVSLLSVFFIGWLYALKMTRFRGRNTRPPDPGLEWDHGEIYT